MTVKSIIGEYCREHHTNLKNICDDGGFNYNTARQSMSKNRGMKMSVENLVELLIGIDADLVIRIGSEIYEIFDDGEDDD